MKLVILVAAFVLALLTMSDHHWVFATVLLSVIVFALLMDWLA